MRLSMPFACSAPVNEIGDERQNVVDLRECKSLDLHLSRGTVQIR